MTKRKRHKKKPRATLPKNFKAPIYVDTVGLWRGSLTSDEVTRQIYQQAGKKFEDLMKHYNIPLGSPEKWWALSFCLARHVGLMDVRYGPRPRGRGKPRKWHREGDIVSTRIDEMVDRRRFSKNSAAANLIKKLPEYKHLTSKSLVNRAGETKRRKKQTPGIPLSAPLERRPEK
jgi:hypothetical protein